MTLVRTLAGANFNNPKLPVRGADQLLTGGTLPMFDFANPTCFPAQASPLAAPLSEISPSGLPATITGNTPWTFAGGGIASADDVNRSVYVSPASDLSARVGHELLAVVWLKCPVDATNSIRAVMRFGEATSPARTDPKNQLSIEAKTQSLYCYVAGKGDVSGIGTQVAALTANAVTQVALHVQPNPTSGVTRISVYKNGAYQSDVTMPYQAWTVLTTPRFSLGADVGQDRLRWFGTIYRAFIEDITVSGRDPAAWVARDYGLNSGRFV